MNSLELEGHWNKTGVTPEKCKGELYMERKPRQLGKRALIGNKLHLVGQSICGEWSWL